MTVETYRYIRHTEMAKALHEAPWLPTAGLDRTHHAQWSVLCVWLCCCGREP